MAIRMLFRSNLWKMSQQIGVNLKKTRSNLGLNWAVSGPPESPAPQKRKFFLAENVNYDLL